MQALSQRLFLASFGALVLFLDASVALAGDTQIVVGTPEPTTLSLLGLGVAACAAGFKLRKRKNHKPD